MKQRFDVDEYSRAKDKDRPLVRNVAAIALTAHELWVPLVPSPEGLDQLRSPHATLVPRPSTPDGDDSTADRKVDGQV